MQTMRPFLAALLALVALPGAAARAEVQTASLSVVRPTLRASIGVVPNTAGYMTIRNTGSTPDRLLSATCACAGQVSAHRTTTAAGRTSMAASGPVVIPPKGEVAFAPGGLHLMFTGLKAPVKAGDTREVVLTFETAGRVRALFVAASQIPDTGAGAHAGH